MKMLSMLISVALIGYITWDMFGDDFAGAAQNGSGKAMTSMSTALDIINSEDFVVDYKVATGKYLILSPRDPTIRIHAEERELAALLRSAKNLQAPTVRIIYPGSLYSSQRQAAYEEEMRSLLRPIGAVVNFQRTLE